MSSLSRTTLSRLIGVMSAIVVLVFAFVLLKGTLGFNPLTDSDSPSNEITDDLREGETALRREQGELLWVTYLSVDQTTRLSRFSGAVVQLDSGCEFNMRFCVLSAETGKIGIQLRFTEPVPPQLPVDLPWLGGYVNPATSAVYDLLGRPYRFQGEVKSLSVISLDLLTEPN